MKEKETRTAICPKCGKRYFGIPATSRVDNETQICPDCGIREALESLGLCEAEQENILAIVHAHSESKGA